jgi:hypothetical protein
MSSREKFSTAQCRSEPSRCATCGAVIRTGTTKPRIFCNDVCRKAEARRFRTKPSGRSPPYLGDNFNAPAVNSAELRSKNFNKIKGRDSGQNTPSVPLDLVGSGYRWAGATLARDLTKKILRAELGTPVATVTGPDGVTVTITPRRSRQ